MPLWPLQYARPWTLLHAVCFQPSFIRLWWGSRDLCLMWLNSFLMMDQGYALCTHRWSLWVLVRKIKNPLSTGRLILKCAS
jgi:hypothetical protein